MKETPVSYRPDAVKRRQPVKKDLREDRLGKQILTK